VPITFVLRPERWSRKDQAEYEINGEIYFTVLRAFVSLIFLLYFVACIWILICFYQEESELDGNFLEDALITSENYFSEYFFWDVFQTQYYIMLTISSVGYGAQYYPYSTSEQVAGIFLMLFGLVIFARFLNTYLDVFDILYVDEAHETQLEDLTKWI
jgi:protein-S-isoprenylcysteine O-methyltransferase Ste14